MPKHVQPHKVHWSTVFRTLGQGNLRPLALYLRNSGGKIDPWIATKLANMIDGNPSTTGFRLVVQKHPGISRMPQGLEHKIALSAWHQKVTNFIAEDLVTQGEKPKLEASIAAAQTEFDMSRSELMKIWKLRKELSMRRAVALAKLRKDKSR